MIFFCGGEGKFRVPLRVSRAPQSAMRGSFDFQRPMAWVMLFSTGIGTLLKNLFFNNRGLDSVEIADNKFKAWQLKRRTI